MKTIPQRELRNNVSDVLRRAERGERFEITVDGRPVAELGPLARPRQLGSAAGLSQMLDRTPVDSEWTGDLDRMRAEDRATASDHWSE